MRRRTTLEEQGIEFDEYGRAVIDGYEVVDLGLPSGTLWATCNVGASTETQFGAYYQYGKGASRYNRNATAYTGTENPLSSSVDTATLVMGANWHMPTQGLFNELINNTNYTWVGSSTGGKFISKIYPNRYVVFPSAGYYTNGAFTSSYSECYIWSSTPKKSNAAYCLKLTSNGSKSVSYADRQNSGYSVRGVHAAV